MDNTQNANQRVTTKLTDYLKERGAKKASIISGPNGDFISAVKEDLSVFTLPVGKRSQAGTLAEMNVLITEDKNNPGEEVAIATMNNYEVVDEITL